VRQLAIALAAPTRDPSHIARLLSLKLDSIAQGLEAGFGFDCVRLSVTIAEKIEARQGDLEKPADAETSAEHQSRLIDALKQRLGPESVRQLRPFESHIPERAEISQKADGSTSLWPEPDQDRLRPPLLLPQPEEAKVIALIPDGPPRQFQWRGETHAVASAQGPERIADEWWLSDATDLTRDYYCLENAMGQCFWLYREGLYERETLEPRWFVHGLFA
jgi:protein ImuB